MVRLYFWIKGAPADRPGGPWWFLDFENNEKLTAWHKRMQMMWHAYAIEEDPKPIKNVMEIFPPKNVKVTFT